MRFSPQPDSCNRLRFRLFSFSGLALHFMLFLPRSCFVMYFLTSCFVFQFCHHTPSVFTVEPRFAMRMILVTWWVIQLSRQCIHLSVITNSLRLQARTRHPLKNHNPPQVNHHSLDFLQQKDGYFLLVPTSDNELYVAYVVVGTLQNIIIKCR